MAAGRELRVIDFKLGSLMAPVDVISNGAEAESFSGGGVCVWWEMGSGVGSDWAASAVSVVVAFIESAQMQYVPSLQNPHWSLGSIVTVTRGDCGRGCCAGDAERVGFFCENMAVKSVSMGDSGSDGR